MGRVFGFAQRVVFCAATVLMVTGTCVRDMSAQDTLPIPASSTPRFGGPQDWSNRHVIYTRNGSFEDMLKLRDDPRFMHSIFLHYMREHGNGSGLSANSGLNEAGLDENSLGADTYGADTQALERLDPWKPIRFRPIRPSRNKNSKVDWSVSLGPTAGMAIGESPAVYTYNYATPSCSTLAAAPPVVGDFIVYTINAAPSTVAPGQANLVGLTNLYTAGDGTGYCSGTGPSFLFSYAIGSGASPLSPVLSLDGTRIAWIENRTATASYLHTTIWVANDGTSATDPIAPTGTFSNGACATAGTSCDYAIEYTNATYPGCPTAYTAGNGHSDLYVDYSSDTGFISANNGLLYHIKNIFSTTTTPSIDFCIPVNATFETAPSTAMSGPVYDPLLKEVFITDSENIYGYTVNAASFSTPPASYTYGNAASNHNYQTGPGPLLDAFNNYLYVFSTYDAASGTSVTQVPTSLAPGVRVPLGNKSTNTNQILFYGAFDNNYYNNGPKSAASTLYSCGTDSTNAAAQDLFAISFNATTGLANTTPAMSNNRHVNLNGTTTGLCSPITEFFDGTTDRIFVGMGMPTATTGTNIVTMWNVTTQLTSASDTPTATTTGTYLGGTSGISADNNASGTAQAQSIYFSTETAGSTSTAVPATTPYNVNGFYTDGRTFSQTGGLDGDGYAYSSTLLGTSVTWNGTTFTLGPANNADAWANTTITLPAGQFSTLVILAAAVNVTATGTTQTFTVNYTTGSPTTLTQNFSDWYNPLGFNGESIAKSMAYRNYYNGTKDDRTFDLYGYSFAIDPNRTVSSITLPATRDVVVLAAALSSNCGGADYCAVKLTQTGLK